MLDLHPISKNKQAAAVIHLAQLLFFMVYSFS